MVGGEGRGGLWWRIVQSAQFESNFTVNWMGAVGVKAKWKKSAGLEGMGMPARASSQRKMCAECSAK